MIKKVLNINTTLSAHGALRFPHNEFSYCRKTGQIIQIVDDRHVWELIQEHVWFMRRGSKVRGEVWVLTKAGCCLRTHSHMFSSLNCDWCIVQCVFFGLQRVNFCLVFSGVSLWCSWSLRPEGKPANPRLPWDALWASMRCCCCSACWCCDPAALLAGEAQFCYPSRPVKRQSTQSSHTQVSVCRNTCGGMGFLIQFIKFSISFHNCINSPTVCNYLYSFSHTFPI